MALWERPEGSALVPPPQSDSWSCAGVGVDGQLPSSKRVSACVQVCLCIHISVFDFELFTRRKSELVGM